MLAQETQEQLSKLGFDVSALENAINSEEETKLDVPELFTEKGHTKEEMTVFGNNRFKEGQTSYDEIYAKKLHDSAGIDLGQDRKDFDKVVSALKEKFSAPTDDKELQNNFKEMQLKYEEAQNKLQEKDDAHKNEMFSFGVKQSLMSNVPKNTQLNSNDLVDLYLMKHSIKNNEGSAVVDINGEIVKDHLLNPIKAEDHFKSWVDSSGLVEKKGMGGDDSKGGSSVAKFNNTAEFYAYAKENGIEPMGEEGQKILSANKAAKFAY